MRCLAPILMVLAACEHSTMCAVPTWEIAAFRDVPDREVAEVDAMLAPNGSVIVTIADPFTPVRFGDTVLDGMYLSRVAPDGTIMKTVPAAVSAQYVYGRPVGVDQADRPVALWGLRDPTLVSYEADLAVRWSHQIHGYGTELTVAVGPGGQVAYRDGDSTVSSLWVLEPDGQERWHVDGVIAGRLGFLASGDVVAFESNGHRVVRRASDGLVLANAPSASPVRTARDGGYVTSTFMPEEARYTIERYGPDNALLWTTKVTANTFPLDVELATNGDVVLLATSATADVLRFDGATGVELSRVTLCNSLQIIGADDHSVVTLGAIGNPSDGFQQYEN